MLIRFNAVFRNNPAFSFFYKRGYFRVKTIDNTVWGYGKKGNAREFLSLQENYELRIRTRTPKYPEFFPVP